MRLKKGLSVFALLCRLLQLMVPCFAAEPEDLPEQPGVTDPQQPEDPEQPEYPDKPGIQPCDAMPGDGKLA